MLHQAAWIFWRQMPSRRSNLGRKTPGGISTRSPYAKEIPGTNPSLCICVQEGERPMNPGEAPSATLWMRTASGLEILTGLGLIVAPSLLAWLLFASDLNAAGKATGRIAGLVMCVWRPAAGRVPPAPMLMPWPHSWLSVGSRRPSSSSPASSARTSASLLWPAAALHLILAVLLTQAWMKARAAE